MSERNGTNLEKHQQELKFSICMDINLDGEDFRKTELIRRRLFSRNSKTGRIFLREEKRWSHLIGGERKLLTKIAQANMSGELLEVDGLFEGGLNVAANLNLTQLLEYGHNEKYHISALVPIS